MNPDQVRAKLTAALVAASVALSLFAGASVVWAANGRVAATRQHPVAEDPQKARVIVRFKSGSALLRSPRVGPQQAATLAGRTGLALRNGRMLDAQTQVVHGQGLSSTALRQRLLADPDVESVAVDERRWALAAAPVVNDPLFGAQSIASGVTPLVGQWYLQAPDAVVVSAINAVGAWALTTGSSSITVAVIDTGVRFDHPDLVGKFFPGPAGASYGYGYDFIVDAPTAADGGGRDDDASDPGDWTTNGECGRGIAAEDSSWHGTQVAGLIGAQTNNGIGIASVGRNVMLLPVRVLGKCGGYDSDIVAAMKWAAGVDVPGVPTNLHPAQVINLSLGGDDNSAGTSCNDNGYTAAVAQLNAKGVVVVVAAGNSPDNSPAVSPTLPVSVPAKCAGVIAVGAVRHAGTKVGFSNLGPEVAISAPGGNCVNITPGSPCLYMQITTVNTGTTIPDQNSYSTSFSYSLGTSFSAPLVAGTAALMISVNPSLTPGQIRSMLQSSARGFPGSESGLPACHAADGTDQGQCYCTTTTCGAGMLDAGAAVASAAATATPIPRIVTPASLLEIGASLTLDGSTSTATPGLTIAAYQWTIASSSAMAAITSSSNAATATVVAGAAGTFTISLTITDSFGNVATTARTLTALAPSPPTARIGLTPASPTVGQSLIVDSNGSAAMPTRSLAAYQWAVTAGAGVAAISGSATGSTATLTTSSTGTFTLSLTVTDSGGLQASTSQIVTVAAAPPPAASGGGAGGLDGRWLLGLAAAVFALRASASKTGRQGAA